MKKILFYLFPILALFIPLLIIYCNVDSYSLTITETSISRLEAYQITIGNNDYDIENGLSASTIFIYLFIFICIYKYVTTKIADRKTGLNLLQRKGDWVLSIWNIACISVLWSLAYIIATFFKINTHAKLESFNAIIVLVVIGIVCKVLATSIYYKESLK